MKSKTIRYSALFTGLLFLLSSLVAGCGQPALSLASPPPPAQPPPATANSTDSQSPEQLPPVDEAADGEEWNMVETFTGEGNETTPPFHVSGTKWRVSWAIDTDYPEYAVFDLFVYPEGTYSMLTKRISYSVTSASGATYIYEGGKDYYIKVISANLHGWAIKVEDYAIKASSFPVQITCIYYKGQEYSGSGTIYYQINGSDEILDAYPGPGEVEADKHVEIHYPIVEPDEYVEIKNLSDSFQDIGGWVLKNITKGEPSFTFPSHSLYWCWWDDLGCCTHGCSPPGPPVLEPHQSIRIYTGEIHPESGGFRFRYPPGDIWNNEEPDIAALYNSRGQELSRRSYIITAMSEVSAGE